MFLVRSSTTRQILGSPEADLFGNSPLEIVKPEHAYHDDADWFGVCDDDHDE
jgi:hypothetical protein